MASWWPGRGWSGEPGAATYLHLLLWRCAVLCCFGGAQRAAHGFASILLHSPPLSPVPLPSMPASAPFSNPAGCSWGWWSRLRRRQSWQRGSGLTCAPAGPSQIAKTPAGERGKLDYGLALPSDARLLAALHRTGTRATQTLQPESAPAQHHSQSACTVLCVPALSLRPLQLLCAPQCQEEAGVHEPH